jgi:murein DD-endopeptidase MepM/ murein hydrolase activator NlpD
MAGPRSESSKGITKKVNFRLYQFAAVIPLPVGYEVFDFSQGYDPARTRHHAYGIGRYNERRPGMYATALFGPDSLNARDIHIGIDIAAPINTPVHAFFDGKIFLTAVNPSAGDYGGTVITEHELGEHKLWALHGHLSHASVTAHEPGAVIHRGDVIGWVGSEAENGGWNPHLHFQLSWAKPERCDLPGAVNEKDLAHALETYPDPRLVLGSIY